jgi:hypothetical protein
LNFVLYLEEKEEEEAAAGGGGRGRRRREEEEEEEEEEQQHVYLISIIFRPLPGRKRQLEPLVLLSPVLNTSVWTSTNSCMILNMMMRRLLYRLC